MYMHMHVHVQAPMHTHTHMHMRTHMLQDTDAAHGMVFRALMVAGCACARTLGRARSASAARVSGERRSRTMCSGF